MARLLALEWDAKEARVVAARPRSGGMVVEHAVTIPLLDREGAAVLDADVGAAIGKALAELGVGKGEVLVAVGRASIELRFLSTPPVPEEELPDLVRFQALRQFTTLGEDWPLDFVPLAPNSDGGMNVLAAAISPDLVKQIRAICTAAGLNVARLVLRPFAAAALLKGQLADDKCRMIVDLLKDDADLTVLIGPQVIFPRTVRLPAVTESEVLGRALLAEGRRTMIAAQNQLGGRRVEEVVIFGDGQHHTALKLLLEKELSLPVKLIDPFDVVQPDSRAKKPEYPGTFAPLLGLLLDEAAEARPVIDFLSPRKRPEPPNRRRTYALAAAAVGALALGALLWIQMSLWALDGQIKQLQKDKTEQTKLADQSRRPVADAEKLRQFAAADVNWLDELARTSQEFPPAAAARVEDWTSLASPKGGGTSTIAGLADRPTTITQIENKLRDGGHRVLGGGATFDAKAAAPLQWQFKEGITALPPDEVVEEPAAAAATAPVSSAKAKTSVSSAKQPGGKP